jgi:hypothetical protein
LTDWTKRIQAKYLMVSLPPDFRYPAANPCAQLIELAVLPHCREFGLPLALMLGVKRAVNPALRLAGDGVGLADLQSLENLCAGFPENKFLVTALPPRVTNCRAGKFRNLHVFAWFHQCAPRRGDGRMRLELIGLTSRRSIPCRVLDQLRSAHSAKFWRACWPTNAALSQIGWEPTTAFNDVRSFLGLRAILPDKNLTPQWSAPSFVPPWIE